jgi:predicted methyltransferase
MFYDKRHSPEVQEWYFRLMNDPEYFEKWRYIDTINDYNNLIAEFQKLYNHTYNNEKIKNRLGKNYS